MTNIVKNIDILQNGPSFSEMLQTCYHCTVAMFYPSTGSASVMSEVTPIKIV